MYNVQNHTPEDLRSITFQWKKGTLRVNCYLHQKSIRLFGGPFLNDREMGTSQIPRLDLKVTPGRVGEPYLNKTISAVWSSYYEDQTPEDLIRKDQVLN